MPANAATQEGMLWAEEGKATTSGDGVCVVYMRTRPALCGVSCPGQKSQADLLKTTCGWQGSNHCFSLASGHTRKARGSIWDG